MALSQFLRKLIPDEEAMSPPVPPAIPADASPYDDDSGQEDTPPADAPPRVMTPPPPPDPNASSTDTKIQEQPAPAPSNNPGAMDGLKKLGPVGPAQMPPPTQPPGMQGAPAPPPPADDDPGDNAPPNSGPMALPQPPPMDRMAQAMQARQNIGPAPTMPTPNLWQRLGAAAVGGMAGLSNARGKAGYIDARQATDNILHPGYREKLAQYNQQRDAADAGIQQADTYAELQSKEQERAAKARQEEAKAGALTEDAETRRKAKEQEPILRAQKNAQDHFAKITHGRDLQAIPAGAPVPPGWDKFDDPSDPSVSYISPSALRKVTPELAPFVPGFKPGDTVDKKTYDEAAGAYNKAQAVAAKPEKPVSPKTEVELAVAVNDPNTPPEQKAAYRAALSDITKQKKSDHQAIIINNPGSGVPGGPSGHSAVAQEVADYMMPVQAAMSHMKPAERETLVKQIRDINPDFDATQFPARNKTALDFSPGGKTGQALTSADTALAHLHSISDAGRALKNGNIQILNKIANEVGAQVGNSPKNTYDTIVEMVGPEISKAVIGGAGGEGDRQAMKARFKSSTNDETREGAIGAAANLLNERVNKAKHSYKSQMGKDLAWDLSDSSKEVLARYQGHSGGGDASAGTGKPIIQHSPSTGQYRYSTDGGKTWQPGQPQ